MFSTYAAAAPRAFVVDSPDAGLILQATEVRLTVSGNIPRVTFYNVGGTDKAHVTVGVSAVTIQNAIDEFIFFNDINLPECTVIGNRIEINGNALNPSAVYPLI